MIWKIISKGSLILDTVIFDRWYSPNHFTRGNVGIGTTSPGALLEVSGGNIRLGNNRKLEAVNTVSAIVNLAFLDASNIVNLAGSNNTNGWDIGNVASARVFGSGATTMSMSVNNIEAMRINQLVTSESAPPPGGILDVKGDASIILRAGLGAVQNSTSGDNDIQIAAEDRLDLYATSYSPDYFRQFR